MQEIWKDVKGYEGYYQVSNLGRVKSLNRTIKHGKNDSLRIIKCRILKQGIAKNGYYTIVLAKKSINKTRTIHSLVAEMFLNHNPNGYEYVINHINHNKLDNNLNNLEITTQRENTNQKHIKSSSKYVGVSWDKTNNKWISIIRIRDKKKTIGRYKTELEAFYAYKNELIKLKK